jgi:hypothetical protein
VSRSEKGRPMAGAEEEAEATPRKACCLVSEIIEESGLDREAARALRRQMLQGLMLFCQWQLDRMEEAAPPPAARPKRRPRRVAVE